MRKAILVLALAFVLGLWIKRNPGERQVRLGAIEGHLEQAFSGLSDAPQFRLMRWLVTHYLSGHHLRGRALDVGSGPGKLAIELARRSPALTVIGIDIADDMVEVARTSARWAGLGDRVSFQRGGAELIPFPAASFDLVVSTLSLHHWGDPVAGLAEVGRVVKPDGRFLIVDTRRDMALLPWLVLNLAQRFILPQALRRADEPRGSILASYTPAEVADLARRANLRNFCVTAGPAWLAIEGGGEG